MSESMLDSMGPRIIAVVASLSALVIGCTASETTASLADFDGAVSRPIPTSGVLGNSVAEVSLPDVGNDGESMRFIAPDGGVLVAYFGYTFCPDVCPTTLADLRTALKGLGADASNVEVAMATVDPGRDSDDVITNYLHAFFPKGHPLRTDDDDDLRAAADAFGVQYSVIEGANGTIEVAHSGLLFAVDDIGEIRAVWPFGVEPETIARDITSMLSEA